MHKLDIGSYFLDKARRQRGRIHAYETLVPARTALVVVDMQNYFVMDGMPSCAPIARDIVPNINRLAEAMRTAGGIVVWVQTEALPAAVNDWANRREASNPESWARRQRLMAKNGDGFAIYAACDVRAEDRIALKTRYSAFIPYPCELGRVLEAGGIDTLLIAGVATSTCCDSTARDAAMWGYRTIMLSDANADSTDELHNHTLGKFLVTFGDVRSTDEAITMLAAGADTGRSAAE